MKLFFDTAPFIYLTENHPKFGSKIKHILEEAILNKDEMITSVVTLAEFGIKPTRDNQTEIIKRFEELLDQLNIKIIGIDDKAARKAYQLRAKYKFLKGMDAFQLAISINENCDQFITNDKDLKRVKEIKIKTLLD